MKEQESCQKTKSTFIKTSGNLTPVSQYVNKQNIRVKRIGASSETSIGSGAVPQGGRLKIRRPCGTFTLTFNKAPPRRNSRPGINDNNKAELIKEKLRTDFGNARLQTRTSNR